MSKRELQHESVRTNRIGAIEQGDRIAIPDILYYENPPVTYQYDELVTYGWAIQQLSGGAKKISIPSLDYPDSTITNDGFSYIVNFGSDTQALIGTFEPHLNLIVDGVAVQLGAVNYVYDGDGNVISATLDGMYRPDAVSWKVNFLA